MKKFFALLAFTGVMAACNDGTKDSTETTGDSATAPNDTAVTPATPAAVKDSLMQFKDGKVMIAIGGAWSPLSATVTTSNGRTVNPNGDVSKNGKTRKLEEGMMIDKDGQMTDKDGKPLDTTGWE
jgi:hypothetical protein